MKIGSLLPQTSDKELVFCFQKAEGQFSGRVAKMKLICESQGKEWNGKSYAGCGTVKVT